MRTPRPIVILGPTAGGKTDLAVALAERLGAEVIGADSMQVYRQMDAGTAKPTGVLRERVPHHLVDVVEPTERFTVHDWLTRADTLIDDLLARGVTPIVVGGTNLYLKALLEGMFDGPAADEAYRVSLDGIDTASLHARLRGVDPASAERIEPADRQRVVRALEVFHLTGEPISAMQTQWREDPPSADGGVYRRDPVLVGLRWPAEAINPRINLRVKAMFYPSSVDAQLAAEVCIGGEDLLTETRRLEALGVLGPQAREALGYKQVLRHLAGEWAEAEAFEKTKVLTRRFAKQQRTWLKRFRGVHWIDGPETTAEHRLDTALAAYAEATR